MRRRATLLAAVALIWGTLSGTAVANTEVSEAAQLADEFATEHQGCLGPLRSAIARGEIEVLGQTGFSATLNPGAHIGTVLEGMFLAGIGVADLEAFCDQFATRGD